MTRKALFHVAARADRVDELVERLVAEAGSCEGAGIRACVLREVEKDPLRTRGRAPRRITLELRVAAGDGAGAVEEAARGIASSVGELAHADLSSALFGEEHAIVPSDATPVRFQYLMRRRFDFTHEGYLRRYLEGHAEFGRKTPGIRGYRQLHLDPEACKRLARATGFGLWQVDSVSELHMDSLDGFLKALAGASVATEGPRDEEEFVDRPACIGFSSDRVQG